MHLAKLDNMVVGHILAKTIITKEGKKLINKGAILSEAIIERLNEIGFHTVYIEDENVDIQIQETLSEDKRVQLYFKLKKIYDRMPNNEFSSSELFHIIRNDLLPQMNNEPISLPMGNMNEKNDIIQHSLNVAMIAVRTARVYGLNTDKVELIAFISLLHDIGKLLKNEDNIPHYELAFEFLKNKNCSVLTYMAIRFQEETYNGVGPYKICDEKQIDLAKILNICDYYETSLRKTNQMPYECFEKTQALVNNQFSPEIFEAFREAIYVYPIGLPVQLSNNVKGIVIGQNDSYPLRPVIKVKDKYYNLIENLSLFIEKIAI